MDITNKIRMHKQTKYLLCLLMFALFSCISNSSNKTLVTNESYITENINFYRWILLRFFIRMGLSMMKGN